MEVRGLDENVALDRNQWCRKLHIIIVVVGGGGLVVVANSKLRL